MKNIIFTILYLLFAIIANAQKSYAEAIQQGDAAFKKGQYKTAINKYFAAEAFDPSKKDIVKEKVNQVFNQIEALRTEAEQAKQDAVAARDRAERDYEELQRIAAQTVTLLLREADQNLLQLNYAAARDKCQAAITLLGQVPEVLKRIQEIAFFYQETGQKSQMDSTLRLLGSPTRGDVGSINPTYYDTLLRRYYPDMVTVEGGTFTMGSNEGLDSAKPPHSVTLSSYQMAKTETTVWQYNLYAVAMGKELIVPSWGLWGDNPINYVDWYDAIAYANWLSGHKGLQAIYSDDMENPDVKANWQASGYRLPTEAEWEFAARGGNLEKDKNYTYSGGNELTEQGWFTENSKSRAQPVAQKKPNALGLYDMSGNVWEWCWDWYDSYPAAPVQNPHGAETGSSRVIRGGSWEFYVGIFRVSDRYGSKPVNGLVHYGFRLSRIL